MYRVTVKIDRLGMVARRGPSEEPSSELIIQAKGSDIPDAIDKAIRHLSAELNAIRDAEPVKVKMSDIEDEEKD